ncbi:MAG: hypothetical protein ACRCWR_00915 [Saezia sp.]
MSEKLKKVAQAVAGHIREPYTADEIADIIDNAEYNAELMMQHLLLLFVRITDGQSDDESTPLPGWKVGDQARILYNLYGPRQFNKGEAVTVVTCHRSGKLSVQGIDGVALYVSDTEIEKVSL